MKVVTSTLDLIGKTPMIQLSKVTRGVEAHVLAKCEHLNPSGSIKDRIALRMIEQAEHNGALKPGYTITDASTGNTGIALSYVGAVKGYRVLICMPAVMSEERAKIMRYYGAEVKRISSEAGQLLKGKSVHGGVIEILPRQTCKAMEDANPDVWWARQFDNPANVDAHRETGNEILRQTNHRLDAFVAAVGTGGTLLGVAEVLKRAVPHVKIIAVEPADAPILGAEPRVEIPGITGGIISEIREQQIVDEVVAVTDQDARAMAHRLTAEEGLFVGMSAGANVLVSIEQAKRLGKGNTVVTVLPDHRNRYFIDEHFTT
jgi:cysteine synthase A